MRRPQNKRAETPGAWRCSQATAPHGTPFRALKRESRRLASWLERLTGPRPAIRTVEVLPPSRSDEGPWVFLSGGFVCLAVIYVLAFQLYEGPGAAGAKTAGNGMLPFQVLFRDLPSPEQRAFRAMKEGLDEALRLRSTDGVWPAVEALAALGIPPFAPDVLDKSALVWAQQRDGLVTEYLGVPANETGTSAFLILMQEPEPLGGEQPAVGVVDEEHQLLADGKLLHVTFWKHARQSLRPGLVGDAALEGWQQIRLAGPFEATALP